MSFGFNMVVKEVADCRRLDLIVSGPMESARFIDEEIAALEATGAPWLFDRLIDLRQCQGHVTYDDINRLADYWNRLAYQAPRPVKVAVVTHNKLVTARLGLMDQMFKNHVMVAFDAPEPALAWIDA